MRTHATTACLLSSLLVLLVATACTGSVVRSDTPIEDLTESTTSSADEVTEIPDIQTTVEEESTVPPLIEEDSTSATEQDVQVTDQPAALDATLDAAGNVESISDDVSSVPSTLEAEDQEEVWDEEDSPAAVKSDEVNYSGWTVLKVGGFNDSSDAVEGVENTEEEGDAVRRQAHDPEYPLLDLEERVGVRVLQENRLEGFYEITVSPSELESVIDDLTARGFQVEDKKIDIGTHMDEATLASLRKAPLQGEPTFDSYMTYEEIEQFILAFTEQNPHTVSRKVIGKSVEGRDIHMLTLSMGGRQCRSLEEDSSSGEEGSRRESRQLSMNNDNSHSAVQQTLEALTNTIRWGYTRDREAYLSMTSNPNQQQEVNQTLQEEETVNPLVKPVDTSHLEPEAITATHMLLEKITQNIPYDYQKGLDDLEINRTGIDNIKHTYDALQEIMSSDNDHSDDYVFLDSTNQPEAVQLTLKVLQRLINNDSNNPKRDPFSNKPYGAVLNRISKSLKLDDVNSTEPIAPNANKTSTDASDIEADILFLLSTFIPKEYTKNATIIESIKKSLIIISKLLPEDGNLTQEVINNLAPQIVDIPGVVGVSSSADGSDTRNNLIIKLANLIRSREDRDKISSVLDGKDKNEPMLRMSSCKPVIFLDGGIHAREWISPAFMVYTLTQLVKNTPLLLGAEWRVVPVLNPDGYIHTWSKDRLWRKNRAKSNGCPGVDLNRNFGYKFGGAGTSTRSCSDIYRGEKAFSEPESKALKAAVEDVKDSLKAYVTVHSYGQMILHPWGYATTKHPNNEQLASMGNGMAKAIEKLHGTPYVVGSASRILYSAAGGSDDWVASLGVPYSFTLELRDNGRYGFVLPASQIKATVEETWAGIEYLGNRIINTNQRSESLTPALIADQAAQDSLFNTIGHTAAISAPVEDYPFAPLVPLTPGFGGGPTISGHGMPMFYSAAVLPREPVTSDATRERRPTAQNSPFQVAPNYNIPQTLQYFNQIYQPLKAQQPFVGATQGHATQEIRTPDAGRPTFSDSIPNVSILGNQQANVQLSPFGSVGQSSPYDIPFAYNQASGNAPLLPVYPNAFYSPQTSSSDQQKLSGNAPQLSVYPNAFYSPQASSSDQHNSAGIQADNVRDRQVVDYLSQVLSSLYRNEALSSSAGSNSAVGPQESFNNYEGSYPVPYIVQNPYWNAPMPGLTPLRQSAYSSDSSSNPSYNSNSNVFIPYNSPMVVRTSTDFGENQQFPFPSQQFQNPAQNVQNFQPSTLEQFVNHEQNTNSYSPPSGFSTAPQFPQFRPTLSSPARPNFKTDIEQVFRQNPNEHIEVQRVRHHFNAEYHRNSPVLVSLGNPNSEQTPSYSNRFNLAEGEIGEMTPTISYHRSLGRQQDRHHRGFEIPQQYRQ